ncbi:MAG: dethiobiotin synthase [bacterium]
MKGVFVTGTGTEVGKTVVSVVIARMAATEGRSVKVFKPALSGLDELADLRGREPGWDDAKLLADHQLLRLASGSSQTDDEISPYRFGPAVSPHLAAEMADEWIEVEMIESRATEAMTGCDTFVCEGVGGFLVPLTPDYLIRDFAVFLDLPVVVVANPWLGTISDTLLTIEAIRNAGLQVVSVVMTPWPDSAGDLERSNRDTISRLGEVPVRELPLLDLRRPDEWPGV